MPETLTVSQPTPNLKLSEADIQAIYADGEETVVSLVTQLLNRLNQLEAEVEDLKGRINKNSRNSSKPPSGDGFGKHTRSLRRKSDQPSGGQAGHPGQTLEWRSEADEVERHPVEPCSGCGASLATVAVEDVLARQVFALPPIPLRVTEHQVEVKGCPHCGQLTQGTFPAEAKTLVQYGPRLKGMMVYLMESQLLPSHRVCEVLADLGG